MSSRGTCRGSISNSNSNSNSSCRVKRRNRIEIVLPSSSPSAAAAASELGGTPTNCTVATSVRKRSRQKKQKQQQQLKVENSSNRRRAAANLYWCVSTLVILTFINKTNAFSSTTTQQTRFPSSSSSSSSSCSTGRIMPFWKIIHDPRRRSRQSRQTQQQQLLLHNSFSLHQLYGTSKDDDEDDLDDIIDDYDYDDEEEEEDEGMKEKKGLGRNDDDDELQKKIDEQQKQIDLLLSMMKSQQQLQQQQQQQQQSTENSSSEANKSSSQLTQSTTSPSSAFPASSAPSTPLTTTATTTTASMNPLKAMLFIDGTWLYYAIHERGGQGRGCPIIQKFGRGWQRYYYFDWLALPRVICSSLHEQDLGWASNTICKRPVEIVRANVFTSYAADTSTTSWRFQMFQDMSNSNYDIHMFTTIGKNEKCVDINIAVEMLHYATVPNAYDVALLLTGDKDFIPAMIRTRQKGKRVGLISFRNGCNKALSEIPTDSNNHNEHNYNIRDYDVVWIDDHLEELIKPKNNINININNNNLQDGGGVDSRGNKNAMTIKDGIIKGDSHDDLVSSFTFMKVVSDFITKSNFPRVNSRDVGRYLKTLQVTKGRSLLEELKIVYVGLHQFFSANGCFFVQAKNGREVIAANSDSSYWIGLTGDADVCLMKEAKNAKLSKAEKKFFDDYSLDDLEYNREDVYYHTLHILRQVDSRYKSEQQQQQQQQHTSIIQTSADHSSRTPPPPAATTPKNSDIQVRDTSAPELQLPEVLTRDYSQLTVPKLKDYCRENGLKISGTKSQLLYRVEQHVQEEIKKLQEKYNAATAVATTSASATDSATQQQSHQQQQQEEEHETTTDPYGGVGYLENLILEYIHARGGQANSRDLGSYLKANRASPERIAQSNGRRVTALTELKENYGNMINLVQDRPTLFAKRDLGRRSNADDDYGFYIVSRQGVPSRKAV